MNAVSAFEPYPSAYKLGHGRPEEMEPQTVRKYDRI